MPTKSIICYVGTPNFTHFFSKKRSGVKFIPLKKLPLRKNFDKEKIVLLLEAKALMEYFFSSIPIIKKLTNVLGTIVLDFERQLSSHFAEYANYFSRSIIRKIIVQNDPVIVAAMVERLIEAYNSIIAAERILHADMLPNHFIKITACDFSTFYIPLNTPEVAKVAVDTYFLIEKYGKYIYWPSQSVHYDLMFFRKIVDLQYKKNLLSRYIKKNKKLGRLIKTFREIKKVKQSDFSGLSERQLRRYEKDEQLPTIKTFEKISHHFGLSLSQYLQQLEKLV